MDLTQRMATLAGFQSLQLIGGGKTSLNILSGRR